MNQYSGTKQKSLRRPRTLNGQFAPDNTEEIKRLRSIRLTDTAWEKLAEIAEKNQITRT
ncbi:transcriptional regulator, partial [Francisella tularensis]|nr:transcriptional regulator [Francisella tularensis]